MEDRIIHGNFSGNLVTRVWDGNDWEVLVNNMQIVSTGDSIEAEIVAEGVSLALSILHMQGRLKD
jgi:hypothetical protein